MLIAIPTALTMMKFRKSWPPGQRYDVEKRSAYIGAQAGLRDKSAHPDNAGNEEPWCVGYFTDHEGCRHQADARQHAEHGGPQCDPGRGNTVGKVGQPEPEGGRQDHDQPGLGG